MALTLDLTGKFILMTIVVAISTGIIIGFQGGIKSSVNTILPGDSDKGVETIQVSGNANQKIASLIDSCYKRSLKNSVESYVCFIVQSDSGFSFSEDAIESSISTEVLDKTSFDASSSASSLVIRYEHQNGMVVVQ
jgi:hypothetical protein